MPSGANERDSVTKSEHSGWRSRSRWWHDAVVLPKKIFCGTELKIPAVKTAARHHQHRNHVA
jgi:hypothetical protein